MGLGRGVPGGARWFDRVGGFDPGFFLFKEEEDLFLRIRRARAGASATSRRCRGAPRRWRRRVARRAPRRVGGPLRGQARAPGAADAAAPPRGDRLGRAARPPAGPRDPAPAQPLPPPGRRGAGGRGSRVADPRAPRRGGRGARARLGARSAPARRGAPGCCAAGCGPRTVGDAVRRTGARVVHAHNVNPTFGWRALAAAREAGRPRRAAPAQLPARVRGRRRASPAARTARAATAATRCPGVRLNCRGGSRAESAVYAAGLALWQRRLTAARRRVRRPERVRARRGCASSARRSATRARASRSVQRDVRRRSTRGGRRVRRWPPGG